MDSEIKNALYKNNVDIVRFVDISSLDKNQTQGFTKAIVFCLALSPKFILAMRDNTKIEHNEFADKEHETDRLADWLAEYIQQKGYQAYSQSEKNHLQNGNYNKKAKSSRLPHKTIGRLAGLGYIGKNNLLITEEYGCGFSMCTVLTDAPIITENHFLVSSKCGNCDICKTICPKSAIYGNKWSESGGRNATIDVFRCACSLKCMVNCPQTLKYALKQDRTG